MNRTCTCRLHESRTQDLIAITRLLAAVALISIPTLTMAASTTLPPITVTESTTVTLPVHAGDTVDLTVCWHTCSFANAYYGQRVVIASQAFYMEMNHPFSCEPAAFVAVAENQQLTAYLSGNSSTACCTENATLGITINAKPQKTADEVAANLEAATTDTYISLAMIAVSEAVTDPIRAKILRLGGVAMGAMSEWRRQLANDPPDPNYTVISQPLFPMLTPVKKSSSVSREAAAALNAWQTNLANEIAYTRALITALNRAQGAADAGDNFWEGEQLRAAASYAAEAYALASSASALRATLAAALRSSGFQSITLTEAAVNQARSNLFYNGLSTDDFSVLSALGFAQYSWDTSRYVAEGMLSGVDSVAVVALGIFPDFFDSPEWAARDAEVAASYAQLATRNGVSLLDPRIPYPPTFGDVTDTAVRVMWVNNVSGATSFTIQRAALASGPWATVASDVTDLSIVDAGLAPSTTYYYRLRASDSSGVTAWSSSRDVRTLLPAPSGPPGPLTLRAVYSTAVNLEWATAPGATMYKIERAPDAVGAPGGWTQVAGPGDYPGFFNRGLAINTPYWYRVRGTNNGSDGPYSDALRVVTSPDAPSAPTFSNVGPYTVTVSWTAPPGGATTYKLERRLGTGGAWILVATGTSALRYVDSTVSPNVTYWYQVRATNEMGFDGVASSAAAASTPADPALGYLGCYTDQSTRAFPITLMFGGATVESCIAVARARGLRYASLQYYGWCYGGDVLGYVQVADTECNTPCTANPAEYCGGSWRNSVYLISSP